MPTATPRCVCLSSGHCWYCLDNGRRCSRPECRCTCADGVACGRVLPVRRGGAPRLPLPVFEDGGDESMPPTVREPELHDDCACVVIERDAPAPVTDLESTLRASLRPLASWASKPAARHAMAGSFEPDAHERARMRRIGRAVVS